jgi:hypothetical protein
LCGVTAAEAGLDEEEEIAAIDRYGMRAAVGFAGRE